MVPNLRSPRARRRAAAALSVVTGLAALGLASRVLPEGRADLRNTAAPSTEPVARTAAQPKPVPLSRADRRAIDRALDRFVPAAVKREDPALAFDLVTPAMRAGTTRSEWATGTLPVQPFPARGERFHHWTLSYSHRNYVGLELLLEPTKKAEIGAIAFAVDVKRVRGRWLVDTFIPAAVFAGAGAPPRISAVPDFGPTAATSTPGNRRLEPIWLLVPGAILSLGLVILIAYGLSSWLRGRRAVRAYESVRPDARRLPALPAPTRTRIALARPGRNR
jgi:hypothetical protein